MTPKEKAIELRDKFYFNSSLTDLEEVKQCALIAVDEIITEYGTYFKVNINGKYASYWQEVKQEIENL